MILDLFIYLIYYVSFHLSNIQILLRFFGAKLFLLQENLVYATVKTGAIYRTNFFLKGGLR